LPLLHASYAGTNSFHIYQAELFPTKIRSSAIGIPYAFSRITAGVLPFGALALLARFGPVGVFTGSAVLMAVLCLAVAILGPRTTGRSLESVTAAGPKTDHSGPNSANGHRDTAAPDALNPAGTT
jgi:putative MFS transporter